MKKLSLALAVATLAGTACWPFSDDAALAEMTVRRREGKVQVIRAGEIIEVKDVFTLEPRDVVETGNGSLADLRLEGTRRLVMTSETNLRIKDSTAVEARTGSVLAETEDPLEAAFGNVVVQSSDAVMRIDQGIVTARAGVYRGRVALSAPGEDTLEIGPLYEAGVTANDLPRAPRPYRLEESDPWDRQWLEDVVELEEELTQLTQGLKSQLGGSKPTLAYFRELADGDDVGFMKRYLSKSPTALLVAFVIASHTDMPLEKAFRRAFSLFEAGAKWGVVAKILGADFNFLIADLEDIVLGTTAVAGGSGGRAAFTVAAAEAAEAPTAGAVSAPGPRQPPPDADGPPDERSPKDDDKKKPKEPADECSDVVECAEEDIKDKLQPSPTPTPTPGVLDIVDASVKISL